MVQIAVYNPPVDLIASWTELKAVCAAKSLSLQHVEHDTHYVLFAVDGPVGYRCTLVKASDISNTAWDFLWTAQYTPQDGATDTAEFEAAYKTQANKMIGFPPKVPMTDAGFPRYAVEKPDGSSANFYSHNWCDPTTWYSRAALVTDEVAVDVGDHKTYDLHYQNVVDTYHGKITQEDFLTDPTGNTYRVSVKVNNVNKNEVDPHTNAGDYTVNYAAGTITFGQAQAANDVVKVTYHYATTSEYIVAPTPGKVLALNLAEAQFSADFQYLDTVVYEVRGYADVFAPQLLKANGGPLDPGTKVPLKQFIYKGVSDFLNDSMRAYPSYPALGGNGWRGMQQTFVFDWDYIKGLRLYSAYGMELACSLQHDTPFGGTFATVTFYCDSSNT